MSNFSMENYIKSAYKKIPEDYIHPLQGDIFISTFDEKDQIGIIVISNECDLTPREDGNIKLKYISYLPVVGASLYIKNINPEAIRIIQQRKALLFYLPAHQEMPDTLGGVVLCERILSEQIDKFQEVNKKPVLSLKTPYRENLCHKVAYLFNRIPNKIPEEIFIRKWHQRKIDVS